jgi:hypothetical protein
MSIVIVGPPWWQPPTVATYFPSEGDARGGCGARAPVIASCQAVLHSAMACDVDLAPGGHD